VNRLKEYELRAKLEQELRWATHKHSVFDNRVNDVKLGLEPLREKHQIIEKEYLQYIESLEESQATFFDIMKQKQLALDNLGKRLCPYCQKYFSPQGITGHMAACTENPDNIKKKEPKPEPPPKVIVEKTPEPERMTLDELEKELEEDIIEEEKLTKEEIKEIVEEVIEEPIKEENGNKVECPECHEFYTKGGAFFQHYKSHFPNGNGGE
jgi:hypothetical protein